MKDIGEFFCITLHFSCEFEIISTQKVRKKKRGLKLKLPIFLKLTYGFNAIPIKMPAGFLKIEIDKYILKFKWKFKGLIINQNNFEKEKHWKMYT